MYSTQLIALVVVMGDSDVENHTFESILPQFTFEYLQVIIYYEWEQNEI